MAASAPTRRRRHLLWVVVCSLVVLNQADPFNGLLFRGGVIAREFESDESDSEPRDGEEDSENTTLLERSPVSAPRKQLAIWTRKARKRSPIVRRTSAFPSELSHRNGIGAPLLC